MLNKLSRISPCKSLFSFCRINASGKNIAAVRNLSITSTRLEVLVLYTIHNTYMHDILCKMKGIELNTCHLILFLSSKFTLIKFISKINVVFFLGKKN